MKVLIDISHPAHVHFYRHMYHRLVETGHKVCVVARDKDVVLPLLDAFGIPCVTVGKSGHRSMLGQFRELIQRDAFLVRLGRKFRPDLILTRNPSGVQAARVLGATGVFDTDDGRSVGVHYRAAAPFAHVITAPDCLTESFGAKARKYPSYKALAYLHPELYTPDVGIRGLLDLGPEVQFSVVRLVAHDASHDRRASGLNGQGLDDMIRVLADRGPVFVSSEAKTPPDLDARPLSVSPAKIHDVLAEASIVVGDSQSVTTEASLLGTPAVRINTYAASTPYMTELERRYRLLFNYFPDQLSDALLMVQSLVDDPETSQIWNERRTAMLADKVNLTDWYLDLIHGLFESGR